MISGLDFNSFLLSILRFLQRFLKSLRRNEGVILDGWLTGFSLSTPLITVEDALMYRSCNVYFMLFNRRVLVLFYSVLSYFLLILFLNLYLVRNDFLIVNL